MKPSDFFRRHPVFRYDQFLGACYPEAPPESRAPERALRHHQLAGRIVRLRRGLYASLDVDTGAPPNSFLIAAQITPGAVLAYHTALEYLGLAHSLWTDRLVVSQHSSRDFDHAGVRYRVLPPPGPADTTGTQSFGVRTHHVAGIPLRCTSTERTLVDLLDRPEYSGGWEELWLSLDNIDQIAGDEVIQYVRLLDNRTTAARVGWVLESRAEEWSVAESILSELEGLAPRQPTYLARSHRRGGTLLPRWNLIVPESAMPLRWVEVF